MSRIFENLIANEWLPSTDLLENRNPSDITDVIGEYAQASLEQLDTAVAAARKALAEFNLSLSVAKIEQATTQMLCIPVFADSNGCQNSS